MTERHHRTPPDEPAASAPDLRGMDAAEAQGSEQEPLTVSVRGWSSGESPLELTATEDLTAPRLKLSFNERITTASTVTMTISASGIETLRIRAAVGRDRIEEFWVSLDEPSYVHHTMPYAEVLADPESGVYGIEFDIVPEAGERFRWISLEAGEIRNWRLHPGFPGGRWFDLPATVPAGATLMVAGFTVAPRRAGRTSQTGQGALNWSPPPPGEASSPRDAVIFASWVPEHALDLGGYFLDVLKRRHPGAKHFIGINHGSSPEWEAMIRASGLDADLSHVGPGLTMPYDPAGFVAALDAYRRSEERFRLAWFGHTKGGLHLNHPEYGTGRWAIERWFWSAHDEVSRAFAREDVGVWAPHWLMFQPEHLEQTTALRRMYDAPCAPLGAMAVSAHFVMRDECLRAFVNGVDPRLFTAGPAPFGGDRYFVEFALPNVPLVQGWRAAGPEGEGGRSGLPACGALRAVLNDWRQNNAMMRCELDRWAEDPIRFTPLPVQHGTFWMPPD